MATEVMQAQLELDTSGLRDDNHRFAQYLETTRRIRDSNMTLEKEISIYQTTTSCQIKEIQDQYTREIELADREQMVMVQEREQLHSQIKEQEKELDSLQEVERKLREEGEQGSERLKGAQVSLAVSEKELGEIRAKVGQQTNLVEELEGDLEGILENLESEISEREVALRELSEHNSELEQSREELSATLQERRGGKDELRSSYELKRMQTIDEVEERIASRLEEVRIETEETALAYRRQTEEDYRIPLQSLREELESCDESASSLEAEVTSAWEKLVDTNKRFRTLVHQHMELERKVGNEEICHEEMRRNNLVELRSQTEDIRSIKDSLGGNLDKIRELLALKMLISHEVDTYQTLLEEEERRLNLNMDKPRRTRAAKKRRHSQDVSAVKEPRMEPVFKSPPKDPQTIEMTSQTHDAFVDNPEGFLHISNVDSAGRYIMIKNNSDLTENLGGYKIKHSSVDETQVFKFKSHSKLQPGKTVRIWANCLNARNSPPSDVIWRSQFKWITSRVTKTLLINPKGEKLAVFTQRTKFVPQHLSPQKQTPQPAHPTEEPPLARPPQEGADEPLREACTIM